jgi:hypothetical protein
MHFLTGSFIFLWCDIEARKYLQALPSVAQRLAFEIAAGILHRETTHTDPHPYRHRYCEPTPTQTHLQLRLALTNSDFLNDSQDTMR